MSNVSLASYNTLTAYGEAVRTMRAFFLSKKFIEVEVQSRRSILAACEDPDSIATYTFAGEKWPLPQTGQMWLEHEILKNPMVPGVFCLTTSYRDEKKINSDRHLTIFPMFEFESHGDMNDLQALMAELFECMGFGDRSNYKEGNYNDLAHNYGVSIIEAEQEAKLAQDFSNVFFLKNFPMRSHPFWNMKKEGGHAKKIDAILHGIETVGSAERSCDVNEMRDCFYSISDGAYAQKLFNEFSKERVEKELDDYLSNDFFPRFGGGIGVTRMIRACVLAKEQQNSAGLQVPYASQVAEL